MGINSFLYRTGAIGQTARTIGRIYIELKSEDFSVGNEELFKRILMIRSTAFINTYPEIYQRYLYYIDNGLPWKQLVNFIVFLIETESHVKISLEMGSYKYFQIIDIIKEELLKVGVSNSDL